MTAECTSQYVAPPAHFRVGEYVITPTASGEIVSAFWISDGCIDSADRPVCPGWNYTIHTADGNRVRVAEGEISDFNTLVLDVEAPVAGNDKPTFAGIVVMGIIASFIILLASGVW